MTDKRVAIIVDGNVVNVVIVTEGQDVPDGGVVLQEGSLVGPGYTYADGKFTPPLKPVLVPDRISLMQAKMFLHSQGLLDDVDNYMNDPGTDAAARIYWQNASHLHRNHPIVAGVAQVLGLTSEQVDAMFIAAEKIS